MSINLPIVVVARHIHLKESVILGKKQHKRVLVTQMCTHLNLQGQNHIAHRQYNANS